MRLLLVVDSPLDKDAMPLDAEVDKDVISLSVSRPRHKAGCR